MINNDSTVTCHVLPVGPKVGKYRKETFMAASRCNDNYDTPARNFLDYLNRLWA